MEGDEADDYDDDDNCWSNSSMIKPGHVTYLL